MRRKPRVILTLALVSAAARASFAAELLCTASSLETYVGAPVEIQVIIKNTTVYEPPAFPDIEGADVRELRREGEEYPAITRRAAGQGRTVVYTYTVTPRLVGPLTIPPIQVTADGEVFYTSPIQIVAKESEAGDLLFLELIGEHESIYVGESTQATLEIWLQPYSSSNVRLDAEEMWKYTIDEQASAWGPFAENLQGHPRGIAFRAETRPNAKGDVQRYFVYSLTSEVWPEDPGAYDADGVRVVVNYPLKMRRRRSTLLGQPYGVVESRPISAVVEHSRIMVKTPPSEGRPEVFRGAVGQYTMAVTATPNEVYVGDPIALTLTIRGTGRMDLLQAPLLVSQESLTVDFRVPDEELAGTVSGETKQFTQTIRAKHDSVTSIPPIRFCYFDPQTARYVILKSDAIPLNVKEPAVSAVSPVIADGANRAGGTELTPVGAGLLANCSDLQALLTHQSVSVGWGTWFLVVSGPTLWMACLLARLRRDRIAGDAGLERRRSARATAVAAIGRAIADREGSAVATHVAGAVTRYVADRCDLPPGNVTRHDVVNQLRLREVPEAVINKVDELLAECEGAQYGAAERGSVRDLVERARDCVNELQRRKL